MEILLWKHIGYQPTLYLELWTTILIPYWNLCALHNITQWCVGLQYITLGPYDLGSLKLNLNLSMQLLEHQTTILWKPTKWELNVKWCYEIFLRQKIKFYISSEYIQQVLRLHTNIFDGINIENDMWMILQSTSSKH